MSIGAPRNACFRSGGRSLFAAVAQPSTSGVTSKGGSSSASARTFFDGEDDVVTDDRFYFADLTDSSRMHFNLRLIDAVRHRRCLFDTSSPGFRSTDYRASVWDGLAQLLEFNEGGKALQNRWKLLRDRFVRERRKARLTLQTPEWPLYPKMNFLDCHIMDRSERNEIANNIELHMQQAQRRQILAVKDLAGLNRRLIEAVRSHPVLYSVHDANYHKKEARQTAWKEVVADLNSPCNIEFIQRYWKSLRDKYIRMRKNGALKTLKSCDKGVREDMELMRFLDPFLEEMQRTKESNVQLRYSRHSSNLVDSSVEVECEVDMEDTLARSVDAPGICVSSKGIPLLAPLPSTRETTKTQESTDNESAIDRLMEDAMKVDGDAAFAVSTVADIRRLPPSKQKEVEKSIRDLLTGGIKKCLKEKGTCEMEKKVSMKEYSTTMEKIEDMVAVKLEEDTVVKNEKSS